MQKLCQNVIAS